MPQLSHHACFWSFCRSENFQCDLRNNFSLALVTYTGRRGYLFIFSQHFQFSANSLEPLTGLSYPSPYHREDCHSPGVNPCCAGGTSHCPNLPLCSGGSALRVGKAERGWKSSPARGEGPLGSHLLPAVHGPAPAPVSPLGGPALRGDPSLPIMMWRGIRSTFYQH